jgi:peptidoglycan-N-acetylglucosamine deacetylase
MRWLSPVARAAAVLWVAAVVLICIVGLTPRVARASATVVASSEVTLSADPTSSVDPTVTPRPDTSWMARYRGHKVGRIRTSRREVALTFDDGPNFRTDKFVAVLDGYGAKGTFFATWLRSRCKGMGAANRNLLEHGHELANHTMQHEMLRRSYAFDIHQILGAESILARQTGVATTWVRAMGGGVNSTGVRAVNNTGRLYAQWSIDSLDSHARYTAPHRIYHNVVDHVRPGDVILLHVTHPESLAALPAILKELGRRGYRMVTLSELASHGRPW